MGGELDELRARVEALEAALRRERAMFAGGPVVVFRWVAAEGWPVEYVSGNVGELFGWSAEQFLRGDVCYVDVVHPDDRERVGAEVSGHSAAGVTSFEQDYRIVRSDGQVRWLYDYTVVVRDAAGRITHYDGYVLDISARLDAEAAVRRKDEELRRAQKMEALGRLAGGIAHDFNNLLTAVLGHAGLAAAMLPADAPAQEPLGRIATSVERAAALTHRLLAFGRRQVLEPRVADLSQVVIDVAALLEPVFGEQIVTAVSVASEPLRVRVDQSQIEQVVVNLLLNARDAMPGGGRLEVTTRAAVVREGDGTATKRPGPYAVLSVRDQGVGMDASTLARAFDPFFTTKGRGGTGLGLAQVYGVVHQSDGEVEILSAPDAGSTVQVWLPQVESTATLQPESAPVPVVRGQFGGTERVLVVEDDEAIREVTRIALAARGYRVIVATNGAEALELFARGTPVDVVITDLVMPEMGGADLVRRLDELGVPVPVVCVSGYSETPVPTGAHRRQAFLQKPFSTDALLRAIRSLLDREV